MMQTQTKMSKKDNLAFLNAAYLRDYAGMRAALGRGDDATIYSEDSWGNTALHYAVYAKANCGGGYSEINPLIPQQREADQSAQEMVIFLLDWENKMNQSNLVSKKNNDGWAPLKYCQTKYLINTVKTMIERGADVSTTPDEGSKHHGNTPLISASFNGDYDIVKLLLDAGADVNMYEERKGVTALNLACQNMEIDVIEMILKRGPDEITVDFLNVKNEWGETALSYAIAKGLTEIVPELLSRGASLYREVGDNEEEFPCKCLCNQNRDKYKIQNIDRESFRRFLDYQISVKKEKKEGHTGKTQRVADTQIEISYEHFHRMLENGEADKPKNPNGHTVYQEIGGRVTLELEELKKQDVQRLKYEDTATQVMEDMVKISPDHKELLKHPLCMVLLMRKWRKLEWFYYGWILAKLVFLCLLITIAIYEGPVLKDCLEKLRQNTTCTPENMTERNTPDDHTLLFSSLTEQIHTSNASLYYLVPYSIFLIFMILVELLQIGVSLKWWALEMKNWLQLLILILSTMMICNLFKKDANTVELDLHILGLLIPMVFYEGLREWGYHPTQAKYILLLDKVCKTFLWYGTIYAGLVITPAISFYLMIGQNESVYPTEFPKLLTKTFVMFVGEVELFDISDSFKWLEIGFFLFFIFFLGVVLMNLLNALAIVDTRELMDDAEMEMLSSLLETVSFWENLKQEDPNKRFVWSLFSLMNVMRLLTVFVPDLSVFVADNEEPRKNKVMTIRPYDKSNCQKYQKHYIFHRMKVEKMNKHDQPMVVGPYEIDCMFGKMGQPIVSASLDIVNRREEMERHKKREREKEEWHKSISEQIEKIKEEKEEWHISISEHIKRQEELIMRLANR